MCNGGCESKRIRKENEIIARKKKKERKQERDEEVERRVC